MSPATLRGRAFETLKERRRRDGLILVPNLEETISDKQALMQPLGSADIDIVRLLCQNPISCLKTHDCFFQTSGITEAGSSALILKRFELSEAVEAESPSSI